MLSLDNMGRIVRVDVDVDALARAGGLARGQQLSAQELTDAGRLAVKARWEKYYREHPEKLKEKQARDAKRGTTPRGRPPSKARKSGRPVGRPKKKAVK